MSFRWILALAMAALWAGGAATSLAEPEAGDKVYATVDGREMKLRLFMPEGVKNPPLVVYFHGGGWRQGNFRKVRLQSLTKSGFAVASVEYRFTQAAQFPAQIHDGKAALRWLRAHAKELGYDATRVAVAGYSAGAHLAMLMGLAQEEPRLEGDLGEHDGESTWVAAVVSYSGPSDFILRSQNQPEKTDHPKGNVTRLLGGPVKENPEKARLASPVFHVGPGDPPLLIIHGTDDKTVFFGQAERIVEAYQKAGLEVELVAVPNAGHGGKSLNSPVIQQKVVDFLNAHLRPEKK